MQEPLDSDEMMHIAADAVGRNDHQTAIAVLKRCIAADPGLGSAHHLLGAEYAQLGMFDRAGASLARAIELEPALHTACLQLGMLHAAQGQPEAAVQVWRGLETLPADDALRLFADGMTHLLAGRAEPARDCLQRGIDANPPNPALIDDMRKVLARIDAPAAAADADGNQHVMMSAYAGGDGAAGAG